MGELFSGVDKKFEQANDISMNMQEDRIKKLKEIFPEIESDGKIDWEKLKQILGGEITEEDERYRFTWSGKSKAIEEVSIPTTKTLRPSKSDDDSKNWDTTENLYIEGDNLEVLKVLQHSYNGKIKMIYIDPPYNTGNDFIYNDDFVLSMEEAEIKEGLKDEQGITKTVDRLTKNSKDSAKYHTRWLNMMYPRLSLARDLLTDDGVIFISIDDNEVHNLRKVCDEIFGEENFVSHLIWKCRNSLQHNEPLVSIQTEKIVLYTKNKSKWNYDTGCYFNRIRKPFDATEYSNPDNDPRGPWLSSGKTRNDGRASYTVISPVGVEFTKPWIPSPSEFKKWEQEGLIWWGKDGNAIPRKKAFLKDFKGNAITDILFDEYTDEIKGKNKLKRTKQWEIGTTETGTKGLKEIFEGKTIFDYPKPWTLIKYLITISTNKNDIVLDFFSGSGTTSHAVMQLNAEDGGNRQCIMVQIPVQLAINKKEDKPAIEFLDNIKKTLNICEIGKERIRRAGEKILEENKDKEGIENLDIGFKVFKLDDSNFNEWNTSYESLKAAIENSAKGKYTTYKDDRTHLDLVYEIMLKEGHMLTEKVEEIEVNNEIIYKIGNGVMYIFLGKLNTEITNKIIELKNEAFKLYRLESPVVILNETYINTEIKGNAKKSFESNGIKDIKTL